MLEHCTSVQADVSINMVRRYWLAGQYLFVAVREVAKVEAHHPSRVAAHQLLQL
jgi:hypothetical protein